MIPVAILGSADFDVTNVDVTTVKFGPAEAVPFKGKAAFEDANVDGYVDLVFHFRVRDTGITEDG